MSEETDDDVYLDKEPTINWGTHERGDEHDSNHDVEEKDNTNQDS